MHIYPMKKLIIIYGLHLQNHISVHSSADRLLKFLNEQSFVATDDLTALNITVYKSSQYKDHSKLTHVVLDFSDNIGEIKYYMTKPQCANQPITANKRKRADSVIARAQTSGPFGKLFCGSLKTMYLRYNLLWVQTQEASKARLRLFAKRQQQV